MSIGATLVASDHRASAIDDARRIALHAFESAHDGICTLETDGRFTLVNAAAARLLARAADDLIGSSAHEALHPRCQGSCSLRDALERGHERRGVLEVSIDDGSRRLSYATAPLLEHGARRGTVLTIRAEHGTGDLTLALQLREQQIEELQELARIGTWDWDAQRDRLRGSDELHRICGLSPRELDSTIEVLLSRFQADARDRVRAAIQRALERGESFEVDAQIETPEGDPRMLHTRGKAVRGRDGRVDRVIGICQDVSDQRGAIVALEQLLRERVGRAEAELEKERIARLFQEAPAAIAIAAGPEHLLELVNPRFAELLGADVVGSKLEDVLKGPFGRAIVETVALAWRSGQARSLLELPVPLTRPGSFLSEAYFNFVVQPLHDADAALTSVLMLGVEISEEVLARRQVEEKAAELARLTRHLERVNRELDQFAYVASHDLKAPLRGIANLSQWLEEDLGDGVGEQSREYLVLLRSRVHRMEALIDGLLEYSRAGRVRGGEQQIATGALVEEVIDLVAPPDGASALVAPDMPEIVGEKLALHQVFQNLISNAFKHGAKNVRVDCRPAAAHYEFSVSDDGPGIAREYQDRIWEIFQTLEARDKVEGTGIGLALVKKIVESRGGRVSVESEAGSGATFRFLWPRERAGDG